jgi:hypothetical protein
MTREQRIGIKRQKRAKKVQMKKHQKFLNKLPSIRKNRLFRDQFRHARKQVSTIVSPAKVNTTTL